MRFAVKTLSIVSLAMIVLLMTAPLAIATGKGVSTTGGLKELCEKTSAGDRPAICADYDDKGQNADSLVKKVINFLIGIVGTISVVMIIFGGVKYSISAGSPESVKTAKNTIIYALVGLVVSLLAFSIINFVISQF